MRAYASSRMKRKSFYRKSDLRMFLLISRGHIGGPKRSLRSCPLPILPFMSLTGRGRYFFPSRAKEAKKQKKKGGKNNV